MFLKLVSSFNTWYGICTVLKPRTQRTDSHVLLLVWRQSKCSLFTGPAESGQWCTSVFQVAVSVYQSIYSTLRSWIPRVIMTPARCHKAKLDSADSKDWYGWSWSELDRCIAIHLPEHRPVIFLLVQRLCQRNMHTRRSEHKHGDQHAMTRYVLRNIHSDLQRPLSVPHPISLSQVCHTFLIHKNITPLSLCLCLSLFLSLFLSPFFPWRVWTPLCGHKSFSWMDECLQPIHHIPYPAPLFLYQAAVKLTADGPHSPLLHSLLFALHPSVFFLISFFSFPSGPASLYT